MRFVEANMNARKFTTGVGGGFLWMTLWTVVLISIPLGLGYLFLTQRDSGGGTTDDALTVLRRRYASGEIDEEEFDARRGNCNAVNEWWPTRTTQVT